MKALIIGGAGFVGKYLADHLFKECGWSVCVTKMQNELLDIKDADILDLNILENDAAAALLKGTRPDYIFHLAAQSSVSLSWKKPALTVDVNIKGAVNVLEAVRGLDYKPRLLLIGSGEEYGRVLEPEVPINENNPIHPGNIYAATKACQNMLGEIYAEAYNMDVMMIRAFNHIGPGQADTFVVSDFCRQAAEIEACKKEPVIYVGNLSAKRDFTDVRDVVSAYALIAKHGEKGETYNVGSGRAIEIKTILNLILANTKANIRIETDQAKYRPVDVPIIEADIKKLMERTGWRPKIDLSATVRETLDFWRGKYRLNCEE